jgi:hypothetical protein
MHGVMARRLKKPTLGHCRQHCRHSARHWAMFSGKRFDAPALRDVLRRCSKDRAMHKLQARCNLEPVKSMILN